MAYNHNFDELIDRRSPESAMYSRYAEGVLPMHLAETDFQTAEPIRDALIKRAKEGHFGYVSDSNSIANAVAYWFKNKHGLEIDYETVDYAPSTCSAILYGITSFSSPGDSVAVLSPIYHAFFPLIENNGRFVVECPLIYSGGYSINFFLLEEILSQPNCSILLLCNPHNPIGKSWKLDDIEKIMNLCMKYSVFVISDEIFSDLIYKKQTFLSLSGLSKKFAASYMVCIGPAKTFNLSGMRTSAVVIPDKTNLTKYQLTIKAFKGNDRSVFGVISFITAYLECSYYTVALVDYLEKNLEIIRDAFKKHMPMLKLIEPEAGFLAWIDASELESMCNMKASLFFEKFAHVGVRDGSVFKNGDGFFRMSFGFPKTVVVSALDSMKKAIEQNRR